MRIIYSFLFSILTFFVVAQSPVKWSFEAKYLDKDNYLLISTATIQDGNYTYSQYLKGDDGPVKTSFEFEQNANYSLQGQMDECGDKVELNDPLFDNMRIIKFKHKFVCYQKVKVTDASKPIGGYLSFMSCNEQACMPPKDVDFKFVLPAKDPANAYSPPKCNGSGDLQMKLIGGGSITPTPNTTISTPAIVTTNSTTITNTPSDATLASGGTESTTTLTTVVPTPSEPQRPDDVNFQGFFDSKREINVTQPVNGNCGSIQVANEDNLWQLFFLAFLGGLVALLTPCVFPMIPLTVSFFTKGSGTRAKGIRNAIIYGLSIIAIYVTIGIVVTTLFGANTLNAMATNPWVNTAFFLIFVAFAFSFFGYYEITLPSSWSTSTDQAADKGGLIGIFFMAFTLALVSFSCTGPIIGSLLVQTVSNTTDAIFGFIPKKPLVGMFGFSLALALPFALFAMFPSWLNSLPKSGGWMNSVKVTLGFLELAFALKFLSTADLVAHWGWLRWEIFLGVWMLVFLGLGLYHLGKISFPHDNPSRKLSKANWALGLGSLAMVAYLAFGFQYKPLSVLSGLAPSYTYNFFGPKGCVHGIECFHDFDEAVAYAKKVGKPVFVDFTGYGCVNCRKMEENIWVKPEILKFLKEDYVVVSLYVDDEARLFPDDKQKYISDKNDGEKIRTVGAKWSSFQRNNFNEASQPQYILMDNDGKTILTHPKTYTPNVTEYKDFLECGVATFKGLKK